MASQRVVFAGRQPPAKDAFGRALAGLGGLFRAAGSALDALGASVQGDAQRDRLTPNTAWMPFKLDAANAPADAKLAPRTGEMAEARGGKLSVAVPFAAQNAFVAPNAHVIGNVHIGPGSSIWYGAVLRGDLNAISIGANTNVQDNAVIHVARNAIGGQARPTVIGSNVTVGHAATVHACSIGDDCLVGMGAVVLDGAVLEPGSLVAAGAVVAPGTVVPSGQVFAGSPAKFLRPLTPEERQFIVASANNYAALAAEHAAENAKSFEEVQLDRAIHEERLARDGTEYDLHLGIYRDPATQLVLSKK